jgi:hypothetical protein
VDIGRLRKSAITGLGGQESLLSYSDVERLPGFHHVRTFGQLEFYENEHWRPMQVYAASQPLVIQDIADQIKMLGDGSVADVSASVFVPSSWELDSATGHDTAFEAMRPAKLSVEIKSPTEYHIHVKADSPFFLVLSEKYHPNWKVYVGGQLAWARTLTDSPLDESLHFVANSYANGWYIGRQGEYDLLVCFRQQNHVYYGALISLAVLLIAATLYVVSRVRSKRVSEPYETV